MQTYEGFQWKIGKIVRTSGKGELCSHGWLYCYDSPVLAVLLNPIHADIENPRLFKCKCGGKTKNDNGLKRGYSEMTLISEVDLPEITTDQKIKFAILCALEVYKEPIFKKWTESWLSGKDRTARAAQWAAEWAARAPQWAAEEENKKLDLIKIAEKAMRI